ncbi:hypothetical protein F0U61_07080 [Archangium violaceum]|uniref:hypothetical protein n=1 Tax=Archangium violaceum TaxID=83451 RepID=UPI002B2ABBEE|nr:hypothetical protein F0U61_07080 [Archangium violaceum]
MSLCTAAQIASRKARADWINMVEGFAGVSRMRPGVALAPEPDSHPPWAIRRLPPHVTQTNMSKSNILEAGKMVVANGDHHAMPLHQNEGRTSGHYVTMAGIDSKGNFIVRDPADANVKTITPKQMEHFLRSVPHGGYQMAIG